MVRQVNNTNTTNFASRMAARHAKKSAETNPFRNVLDSASKTVSKSAAKTAQSVQIKATVTKETAKPDVVLTTPVYDFNATVTNPDGSTSPLNYTQFADPQTAQNIAAKLGGTVTESSLSGSLSTQRSISVPGSPNLINAGIAARLFAQYGDKPGSLAWQVINRDLGRDPMST